MMIARLERDVRGRTAHVMAKRPGALQGANLGMRLPGALVPALAQYVFAARNHTPDTRVRRGREQTAPRKLERAHHQSTIARRGYLVGLHSHAAPV